MTDADALSDRLLARLVPRERDVPSALASDLGQRVPQASLRDLHRPVRSFFGARQPVAGSEAIGRVHREMALVREARRLLPIPRVEASTRTVAEEQQRRRRWLAEPWQPVMADHEERRKLFL